MRPLTPSLLVYEAVTVDEAVDPVAVYQSSHNPHPTPVPARDGRATAETVCAEVEVPDSPPYSTSLSASITVPTVPPTRVTAA